MFSTSLDCRQSPRVNLLLTSVSAFSPHGYEVMASVAQPSSVNVPKTLTLVSKGFHKCEVIPDH